MYKSVYNICKVIRRTYHVLRFTFYVVAAIKPATKTDRNDFSSEPGNRTDASSCSIDDRQSDFLPTDATEYADRLFPRSGYIDGKDSP